MASSLPTDRKVFQFESASVIYSAEHSAATGRVMPKLEVMIVDQYRYQREFYIGLSWKPGDSKDIYWEWRIYQHPGRRESGQISKAVASRFILKFLELCENYPSLLFNKTGEHTTEAHRPRHEGFVRLAEWLHRGISPTVKLL